MKLRTNYYALAGVFFALFAALFFLIDMPSEKNQTREIDSAVFSQASVPPPQPSGALFDVPRQFSKNIVPSDAAFDAIERFFSNPPKIFSAKKYNSPPTEASGESNAPQSFPEPSGLSPEEKLESDIAFIEWTLDRPYPRSLLGFLAASQNQTFEDIRAQMIDEGIISSDEFMTLTDTTDLAAFYEKFLEYQVRVGALAPADAESARMFFRDLLFFP